MDVPLYVGFWMWAFVYVLCLLGHHSATSLGWIKVNKVLRSSMQVRYQGNLAHVQTSTKLAPQYKEQSSFIIEWASCIQRWSSLVVIYYGCCAWYVYCGVRQSEWGNLVGTCTCSSYYNHLRIWISDKVVSTISSIALYYGDMYCMYVCISTCVFGTYV